MLIAHFSPEDFEAFVRENYPHANEAQRCRVACEIAARWANHSHGFAADVLAARETNTRLSAENDKLHSELKAHAEVIAKLQRGNEFSSAAKESIPRGL